MKNQTATCRTRDNRYWQRILLLGTLIIGLAIAATQAQAQDEVRYSWFEISFAGQDIDRSGSQTNPLLMQTVDIDAGDGNGVKFRGSVGTWKNLYAFLDFSSTDIDVSAVVTNPGGTFPAEDEFDYTFVRGGVGLRFPLTYTTDIYGEVSYDSVDLDFGSFAGENFDTSAQDVGGALGIRSIFMKRLELRAYGRFSNAGDVDLNVVGGEFDSDFLYGVGFGIELIRGLSLTGDFESGEFSNWNIGFRLDLDED